jgi:imidazoleglycerol-phosphate dehydratase
MTTKRSARIERNTRETEIKIALTIEGTGRNEINTEIGFFNHMLELFSKHGLFDITADVKGDLEVDQHHTVEDTGLALGKAFHTALEDKRGIKRAGFFIHPMDEALAMVAVDISGRPYVRIDAGIQGKEIGDFTASLLEDFFQGFAASLGAAIHIQVYYGRSDHHKVEALFKAFGRALKNACEIEEKIRNEIPSSKGAVYLSCNGETEIQ